MLEWGYICPHFEELYFYHSDYLGHTEYITDAGGYPYQYFYYTPFGESLITQHANTGGYSTSFRFNAKELDEETGNYYYGARYYNPRWSVWLGVDPLASERSWLTPYNFVQNNPLMLIDPDGMLDHGWEDCGDGTFEQISTEGGNNVDYIYQRNSEGGLTLKESKAVSHTVGPNLTPLDYYDENFSTSYQSWSSNDGHLGYMKPGVRYSVNQAILPDYTIENFILGGILFKGALGLAGRIFAAKPTLKSFNKLEDLRSLFANKNLVNASDDLAKSGWKKLDGDWGSRTVFEKQIGKQRYYAQWEVNPVHSTTNQPIGYWKLTYGKINATSKNTIRVSSSPYFKP
jgi:RHS repeat-associated protein